MNEIADNFIPENVETCRVFFYLVEGSFPHLAICIAEGLKVLGIPSYANLNYWKTSPETEDYLFTRDPNVTHKDCSVVVLDKNWIFTGLPFPENLSHPARNYLTIYLDDMDGPRSSLLPEALKKFNVVFRTHCNSRTQYPENFVPWSFGLSNRILLETLNLPKFKQRRKSILINFRVDQKELIVSNWMQKTERGVVIAHKGVVIPDYPLRPLARQQFIPLIQEIMSVDDTIDNFNNPPSDSYHELHWTQTGQRHHPNYYKRLQEFAACASFAGWLIPNSASGEPFVEWWDSWRFWESLAAGCVTFHVDFDKYGIELPVRPENWRHYIGIDLDNIQNAVDRIASDPGILERISREGRQWAIDNYGPVPTALRFLKALGFKSVDEFLPFEIAEINVIVFPQWLQSETALHAELLGVLRAIVTHPDKNRMSVLIDTSSISEEKADIILSSVVMELLMSAELEMTDEPAISLVGNLSAAQWEVLRLHLHARIVLENENQDAIARAKLENLPSFPLVRAANSN